MVRWHTLGVSFPAQQGTRWGEGAEECIGERLIMDLWLGGANAS